MTTTAEYFNYFQVNPSFDVSAMYPNDGQARSREVTLRGATQEEAESFQKFFLRTGVMSVTVTRNDPFRFAASVGEQSVSGDSDLFCLDCGEDIYGPGAPAICAMGHRCRRCDKTWVNCECSR